jgi:hypothetical protein
MATRVGFLPAGVGFIFSNPHWKYRRNKITKTRTYIFELWSSAAPTERQKKLGYTTDIAEAEDTSECAAALAQKRDVASVHWAWRIDL